MSEQPGAVQNLLDEFVKLPGIGPKSAERIVHFLMSGDRRDASSLANALKNVVANVRPCKECFNLTEGERCAICSDPRRDAGLLCVVETPRDVSLLERTGSFRGLYHVLGGRLAPLDGVTPDRLNFSQLVDRIRRGGVREVIFATSPTYDGDGTALFATNLLKDLPVKVTMLARGLPTGSSLELANPQMLADALEGRRSV